MESFVRLRLHDMRRGEEVERWFNLRYVRSFDVERNEVMLQGSHSAIKVTDDSMERLTGMFLGDELSVRVRDLEVFAEGLRRRVDMLAQKPSFFERIRKKLGL